MLRRFMCVISAMALLFCLSACSDISIPFELSEFTAQVTIKSTATQIKGELTYNSPEDITFKVKSPENISGMEFNAASQSMSLSVGEVSFTTDTAKDSPVYMLFTLLGNIAQSDISIPLKGEKTVALKCEGETVSVKIDCEAKKIVSAQTGEYTYKFE